MEEIKKDHMMNHNDMCCCGTCSTGHMHGHFGFWIVKLLVALVALLFVFWLGVKVGEVKTFMGEGRYGTGRNMMYLQQSDSPFGQTMTVPGNAMMFQATSTPVK